LNTFEGNTQIIVSMAKKLCEKGYDARKIAKDLAPLIDGKGGGQPFYASISGAAFDVSVLEQKLPEKINEIFEKV
jgi:alanyl-tRNA synthetase